MVNLRRWRFFWFSFQFISAHWIMSALIVLACLPPSLLEAGPTLCPKRLITGEPCLGCGMTRAVNQTLHGDFEDAYSHNKLVVLVFPLLLALAAMQIVRSLRHVFHFKKKQKAVSSFL